MKDIGILIERGFHVLRVDRRILDLCGRSFLGFFLTEAFVNPYYIRAL